MDDYPRRADEDPNHNFAAENVKLKAELRSRELELAALRSMFIGKAADTRTGFANSLATHSLSSVVHGREHQLEKTVESLRLQLTARQLELKSLRDEVEMTSLQMAGLRLSSKSSLEDFPVKDELESSQRMLELEEKTFVLSQFYLHTADLMGVVELIETESDECSDVLILETSPSIKKQYGFDPKGMTLRDTPSPPGFNEFLIGKYREALKTIRQRIEEAKMATGHAGEATDFELDHLPAGIDNHVVFEIPYGSNRWGLMKVTYLGRSGKLKRRRFCYDLQDSTPLKLLLDEVTLKKSELEEALKIRESFLALISHELRTPLNGIIGMSQLLFESKQLTEEQVGMVNNIYQCSEMLLSLVNDILDFSKLQAGQLELTNAPVDLVHIVASSIDLAKANLAARKKNLSFMVHWNIDGSGERPSELIISGDGVRLRQLLSNVLSNAVKFTDEGSVTLTVDVQTTSLDGFSNPINLNLLCKDTGCGIPKDRQDKLFLPFHQVDSSMSRRHQGTGLGLTICRSVVALMPRGKIWCESDGVSGHGSLFGMSMIVELLSEQRIRESVEETTLPGPDTIELPETQVLQRAISGDLAPAITTTLAGLDQTQGTRMPLRILVAEDNLVNQQVVVKMLQRLGYKDIDVANDGIEAMQLFRNAYPNVIPDLALDFLSFTEAKEKIRLANLDYSKMECVYDLLLLDLQMPRVDGFRVASFIRFLLPPPLQPIIIALTANAGEADREKCLKSGFDAHEGKPLRLQTLEQQLGHWGQILHAKKARPI
jgi:signal transduction histidine kinase/DNA-binding NarL/FixJ family response regulator